MTFRPQSSDPGVMYAVTCSSCNVVYLHLSKTALSHCRTWSSPGHCVSFQGLFLLLYLCAWSTKLSPPSFHKLVHPRLSPFPFRNVLHHALSPRVNPPPFLTFGVSLPFTGIPPETFCDYCRSLPPTLCLQTAPPRSLFSFAATPGPCR